MAASLFFPPGMKPRAPFVTLDFTGCAPGRCRRGAVAFHGCPQGLARFLCRARFLGSAPRFPLAALGIPADVDLLNAINGSTWKARKCVEHEREHLGPRRLRRAEDVAADLHPAIVCANDDGDCERGDEHCVSHATSASAWRRSRSRPRVR